MLAVANAVLPEYEGRIVFVDALTDNAGGQAVANRFAAQYVPTSVFIGADGRVAETYVGAMAADQLRSLLDTLSASE